MNPELSAIADDLRNQRPGKPITTRSFLGWFGAQRRGTYTVESIRKELAEVGIRTLPDFESAWLDGPIAFELCSATDNIKVELMSDEEPATILSEGINNGPIPSWVNKDATYRVSKLEAANTNIVSIKPNGTLAEAVTLLLSGDFSQLPVMTTRYEVKGMLTWRSIGAKLGLGKSVIYASDAMEFHCEIRSNSSIFEAIPFIVTKDYVLVRGDRNDITGIIIASDLSLQFRLLTEPFLLLSEIENLVRNMIGHRFSSIELATARDPTTNVRQITAVDDMTFGEYIRLLQNPEQWLKLGIAIDRTIFCENLDRVRKIRNDVMHFDPDGITSEDLGQLRSFTNFLKQLESVGNR